MKKIVCMLLCLVMLGSLLTACGEDSDKLKSYTYDEVTIQVPSSLKEDKDTIEGTGFSFCLSNNSMVVIGLCEDVSILGESITEEEYVDMMVQANGLNATLEKYNGHTLFVYTSDVSVGFTYVGCCYKHGDEFWTIQAYTPTSAYNKNKDTLFDIVTSAQIN